MPINVTAYGILVEYLKDKYQLDPEKFENLTEADQAKMIYNETLRICELNGFELVEKDINSKKQIVTKVALYSGHPIKVQ